MTPHEQDHEHDHPMQGFLGGLLWKTIVLGFAAGLIVGIWLSPSLGRSVAAGAGLAAANAAALAWLAKKILRPDLDRQDLEDREMSTKTAFWAVLLGIKLVALLTLAFLVIVVFGVEPLGLAIGYTMFLGATLWQTVAAFGVRADRSGGDDEDVPKTDE